MGADFSKYEESLVEKAIRRKKLFLLFSIISVVIAVILAAYYTWEAYRLTNFNNSTHFVIIILILLNGRQNLRQYHYAKVLEKLMTKKP